MQGLSRLSVVHRFGKHFVLQLLRAYKWAVSPMFLPACRYVPTCSEYAMEAVERYGALRGGLMALLRLLRCHPFAHGGYDPVFKQQHSHPSAPLRAGTSQRTREMGHPHECVTDQEQLSTSPTQFHSAI